VLGQVAEKYPDLIELISNEGHEIASHGYSHKMLYQMDKNEFENEIKKSIKILTKITHEKPRGFRAPCFSINNDTNTLEYLCIKVIVFYLNLFLYFFIFRIFQYQNI